MTENQELFCHACRRYVQFRLDTEMNGAHTIECPNCGHEHYRYVNNGIISDQRWASSQPAQQYRAYTYGYTTSSTVTANGTSLTYIWTSRSYGTSTT